MSLHPSLKRAERMAAVRSVMTRTERIKWLMGKGTWEEGSRPFGLPKIKIVRLKAVKKEKKEEKPEEGTPEAAPAQGQAAASKGGAAAKGGASSAKQK